MTNIEVMKAVLQVVRGQASLESFEPGLRAEVQKVLNASPKKTIRVEKL